MPVHTFEVYLPNDPFLVFLLGFLVVFIAVRVLITLWDRIKP